MLLGKFINQIKLYCENNNIHNYNIRQKRHIHEPLGRTAHNIHKSAVKWKYIINKLYNNNIRKEVTESLVETIY